MERSWKFLANFLYITRETVMHHNVSQKTLKKSLAFYKMNLSGKKQENRAKNEAVVREMF